MPKRGWKWKGADRFDLQVIKLCELVDARERYTMGKQGERNVGQRRGKARAA